MELPIGRLVGLALGIVTLAIGSLNGAVMLFSPRKWFDLPEWLSAKGTLTRERYSKGAGAIQIRLLGAAFLALTLWMSSQLISGLILWMRSGTSMR
jgi:hypothetical protein